MGLVSEAIGRFNRELSSYKGQLVAISKTKPTHLVMEAYDHGHRDFGENKVQELASKYEELPKDIKWHMVGHLQTNKVKFISGFVHLIHSVDSLKLLKEINKQGAKHGRQIEVLMQIHIAREETKYGLNEAELVEILNSDTFQSLDHVKVIGLMGMATHTDDENIVNSEFAYLKELKDRMSNTFNAANIELNHLSMGMTGDYKIALENGATLIRIGSAIFGARNY